MSEQTEHSWFSEHLPAYVAGGLTSDERSRLESHAGSCETCAAHLVESRDADAELSELFKDAAPAADFEDQLIASFRSAAPRLRIRAPKVHPAVRVASVAAAAAIVLGGFGYFASQQIEHGRMSLSDTANRIKDASNLNQIGHAILLYSNEAPGVYPRQAQPSSGHWDAGDPQPPENGSRKLTEGLLGGRYGDGHVEFRENPLVGVQRDNIYVRRAQPAAGPAASPYDLNDSILVPTDDDDDAKKPDAGEKWDFGGGSNTALNWNEWDKSAGIAKNLSYSYQNPYPDQNAISQGYKLGREPTLIPRGTDRSGIAENKTGDAEQRKTTDSFDAPKLLASTYFKVTDLGTAMGQPTGDRAAGDGTRVAEAEARFDASFFATAQGQQAAAPPATAPAVVSGPGNAAPAPAPATLQRKIIRNGEMEFEVDSFDSALSSITKIAAEEGGAVATTNSQKLPNGKVKGIVVVRVSPDHLDMLVLKLRALGDLKRQNLTASDITKEYHDLDGELRAAKAMQDRLLAMIKDGKGQIKDLLAAEKELAVWREKAEKIEGQMHYYDAQVASSTLAISVTERDVKASATTKQQEQADVGIEADDVEKARADAIKAIDDAKGRIIESELKKFEAGQLAARIVADVSPDNAGPAIDRLKQLGKVARLEINRKQTTPDNTPPLPGARLERGDTRLVISLYNLANIAPRHTTNVNLSSDDVEAAYAKILASVAKADGRVVTSNLTRGKPDQTNATISFEVRSDQAEPVQQEVRAAGEVMKLLVTENPDTNNVTSAKRGFQVTLVSSAAVLPRETKQLVLATADVAQAHASLAEALRAMNARLILSRLDNERNGRDFAGYIDFEVKRDDALKVEQLLAAAGDTVDRQIQRNADAENVSDLKVQYKIQLHAAAALAPRETTTLGVEVSNVERALDMVNEAVGAAGGRKIESSQSSDRRGTNQSVARLVADVPLAKSAEVVDRIRGLGDVRVRQVSENPRVPDGKYARARIEVTLGTPDAIVLPNQGLWASIRRGLSTSVTGLAWSLQLIVIGLCFVAPWGLLLVGGWKLARRARRKPMGATPAPA